MDAKRQNSCSVVEVTDVGYVHGWSDSISLSHSQSSLTLRVAALSLLPWMIQEVKSLSSELTQEQSFLLMQRPVLLPGQKQFL